MYRAQSIRVCVLIIKLYGVCTCTVVLWMYHTECVQYIPYGVVSRNPTQSMPLSL